MKIAIAFRGAVLAVIASASVHAATVEQQRVGEPTKVVILGVDHSAQLVSEADQPGMLTAFIEQLQPDAICIERTPELAERRDFYEFTYEVQGIVIPYVKSHPTDLCPMDWMPTVEDQKLAFGSDLDVPPEIRPKSGYQSFMVFRDPNAVHTDFLEGDDPKVVQPVIDHMLQAPHSHSDEDFPRRLYLYRTYLMAEHIRAAAHAHPGGLVLVIVGYFHKPDLESHLKADPTIRIVAASKFGAPGQSAAEHVTTAAQRAAILSFNLLGRQAETSVHDLPWLERVLAAFANERPGPEAELFRVRLEQLAHRASSRSASDRYMAIARQAGQLQFTWTGQKDTSRLDSYFDPFGGLGVADRARLEAARARLAVGDSRLAKSLIAEVRTHLDERRARQFDAYVRDYVDPDGAPAS